MIKFSFITNHSPTVFKWNQTISNLLVQTFGINCGNAVIKQNHHQWQASELRATLFEINVDEWHLNPFSSQTMDNQQVSMRKSFIFICKTKATFKEAAATLQAVQYD